MKVYNKLVRDNIIDIIKDKWEKVEFHFADKNEYWNKLKEKLQEEILEVLEEDDIIGELADVMEVIYAICEFKNIDFQEIEKIRKEKIKQRWWFTKKIILEKA